MGKATTAQRAAERDHPDLPAFRRHLSGRSGGPTFYARLLGLDASNVASLVKRVEAGFSFGAFERLQRNLDLSATELAALVQISPRTLARRKEEDRLSPEESDRLLRVSRVFGLALALFRGDVDATRAWFSAPAPALGGRTPQDLATTEIGAREVENLLGRLEHGVFS